MDHLHAKTAIDLRGQNPQSEEAFYRQHSFDWWHRWKCAVHAVRLKRAESKPRMMTVRNPI